MLAISLLRILAASRRTFTSFVRSVVSEANLSANSVSLAFVESTCSGLVLSGGLLKWTLAMFSKISFFKYGLYFGLLGKVNPLAFSKPIYDCSMSFIFKAELKDGSLNLVYTISSISPWARRSKLAVSVSIGVHVFR